MEDSLINRFQPAWEFPVNGDGSLQQSRQMKISVSTSGGSKIARLKTAINPRFSNFNSQFFPFIAKLKLTVDLRLGSIMMALLQGGPASARVIFPRGKPSSERN